MSTQADLETSILLMLYEESGRSVRRLKASQIAAKFRPPVGETRVAAGLQHLQSSGLVSGNFDNTNASGFVITRAGLLRVEEKFDYKETEAGAEFRERGPVSVPAADRTVFLNHNEPDYKTISDNLTSVTEAVRESNNYEADPTERDHVLALLRSAKALWAAAQLKVIQIKVGVLLAAEDASRFLTGTARAVAATLLVDAIKAFVKNHCRIDLDHI